jgi:hypothetical protein
MYQGLPPPPRFLPSLSTGTKRFGYKSFQTAWNTNQKPIIWLNTKQLAVSQGIRVFESAKDFGRGGGGAGEENSAKIREESKKVSN